MPSLTTQKELQSIQKLGFCYFCGEPFDNEDKSDINRDHVPPRALFAKPDRTCPLILPSHEECNSSQSQVDEVVGQLVSVLHGRYPTPRNVRLDVDVIVPQPGGVPIAGLKNLNFQSVLIRWIRAFHAALYGEYLENNTRHALHPPFFAGHIEKDGIRLESVQPQFPLFVEVIKRNRVAGHIDRITAFNGKLRYECVWDRMDDGLHACFFALDIYNWHQLGDPQFFPQRGCVGWYQLSRATPASATLAVDRELPIRFNNTEPLNPFGE
jgi:hypothetical protein